MKKRYYVLIVIFLLGFIVLMGDRPKFDKLEPRLPALTMSALETAEFIQANENKIEGIKEDNHARIVWADSVGQTTEYVVVYFHGFSSSLGEGDPVHRLYAKHFGMNLYLTRFADHGLEDVDAFENLTPESYLDSAKEALVLAQNLGEKVIIMGCSTGATLANYLAAEHPQLIHALSLYCRSIDAIRIPGA